MGGRNDARGVSKPDSAETLTIGAEDAEMKVLDAGTPVFSREMDDMEAGVPMH